MDREMKEKIRLLILDVDGTLTDGGIHIASSGELYKSFNVKDGYGIAEILPGKHIDTAIITGRTSDIVAFRAKELKIRHLYQGVRNKIETLNQLKDELGLSYPEIAYIGDDLNDVEAMKLVGLVGCPLDAVEKVRSIADFISSKKGGEGAVREFIDWLTAEEE